MAELEDFNRELSDEDPGLIAAMQRFELLRAHESDIPDLDNYRARRRLRHLPPDAS